MYALLDIYHHNKYVTQIKNNYWQMLQFYLTFGSYNLIIYYAILKFKFDTNYTQY